MSDAEYYMEQQEEEERFRQEAQYAASERGKKYLFCWTDKRDVLKIWDWKPLSRVNDVFADLYNKQGIGTEYFAATQFSVMDSVWDIEEWDEEEWDQLHNEWNGYKDRWGKGNFKKVHIWKFVLAEGNDTNIYEVIVVTRKHIDMLRSEAVRQITAATNLKQRMLAEMLIRMTEFINKDHRSTMFVFARMV